MRSIDSFIQLAGMSQAVPDRSGPILCCCATLLCVLFNKSCYRYDFSIVCLTAICVVHDHLSTIKGRKNGTFHIVVAKLELLNEGLRPRRGSGINGKHH